jgi:phage-related protein
MAEEIVGVKIQVDATDMNKSVGDLRKKIVETEAEVKRLQQAYGEQSKEAIEGQKRLAQLQDITNKKIDQQNQRIDDAAKTVSALSAAYGGVQGALELTGLAGEDTIKQLAKIQSALAIGDAIQNLAEFRGAITNTFKSFGASIKTTFSTLRSSLIATGIGAFVVALGLVAANFETVKKVVLNLIPGLGSVADFIGNLVNKVTDFIGITSEAGRATEKLIKDNDKAIKEGERNLDLNGDKYDEFTQRKIKANIEFLDRKSVV